MKTLSLLIILFATLLSAADVPRLTVDGRHIVDHEGDTIFLRGFNHSRWGEVLEEDPALMKEIGANMVRTCLRWNYWGRYDSTNAMNARDTDSPGHIKPDYLEKLDSTMKWFSENEVWTILFVNADQGSGAGENHFLNTPALKQEFIELWLFLADRYKDYPYIGAWEILAEPRFDKYDAIDQSGNLITHADLGEFYQEMCDTINTVTGGSTPFVVGAMSHYKAKDLTSDYLIDGHQVIYAANMLWPKPWIQGTDTTGLVYPSDSFKKDTLETYYTQPLAFRDSFEVPVWVDQFGASFEAEGYLEYHKDLIAYFHANDLHYSHWNWRESTGNRGIFERIPAVTGDFVKDTALFNLYDTLLTIDDLPVITSSSISLNGATVNSRRTSIKVGATSIKLDVGVTLQSITLTDLRGRTIYSQNVSGEVVDLSSKITSRGVYLLQMETSAGLVAKKIVR